MASIFDRLEKLEGDFTAQKKTISKLESQSIGQKKILSKLESESIGQKQTLSKLKSESVGQKKTLSKLESELIKLKSESKTQTESFAKMQLRVEMMDLEKYELYVENIGASRRVVAYGILEYVHSNFLTPYVRSAIQEKSANLLNNEKNQYLKFLNEEVFNGKWQEGTYEEIYIAWAAQSTKSFLDKEVAWLEELLIEFETKFIAMAMQSNDLTIGNTKDLRKALGRVLSLERYKRNQAWHSLSMGENKVCLQVVEDLMVVLDKGQLNEHKDVAEIMKFGCKLYKGSKLSE